MFSCVSMRSADVIENNGQRPADAIESSATTLHSDVNENSANPLTSEEQRKPSIFQKIIKRAVRKSTLITSSRTHAKSEASKVKLEVERLWKVRCCLYRKEKLDESEISLLRSLINDTLDLTGRLRVIIRDKETYSDEDVETHSKDLNGLQMLLHNIIEIWVKVKDPQRKTHKIEILTDLMDLCADIASVFGEVMLLFLQNFELNILPLLRSVHGLFYGLSLHCKYNGLDKDVLYSDGAPSVYSGFLSGCLQLLRSTKILLKRLKFEDDQSKQRRQHVQSAISSFVSEVSVVISHGLHAMSTDDIRETMFRVGSVCTDVFFTMGKTKGVTGYLDLGEGVEALHPAKYLGDISHIDIARCPIEKRSQLIRSISLNDGQHFISDFFQTASSTLQCQEKITLRCPIFHASFPASATIKVKIKCGDKWMDAGGDIISGCCEFQTKFMQAFVVVAGFRPYHREITPEGFTYISDDDSRIRINFPENCFSRPCIVQFRLIQLNRTRIFSYKETSPDECKNITCISDVLYIKHDGDVEIKEPALIHMPILNDVDDYETEIVVFRRADDGRVEVIPRPSAMRCESTGNCYTFQTDKFGGIALGKVYKKQLKKNKKAIIDEFNLYFETDHMCSILTFVDKELLQAGVIKMWTECVEKRFAKRILRRRSNKGLFELPGSRSHDIRMRDYDIIRIELDGNIAKVRELPFEHFFITFLSSSGDNYRSFPVEPRRDYRGRNIGVINYHLESEGQDTCIHMASMDTSRLLNSGARLPTSHSEKRPTTQYGRATWSRGSQRSSKSVRSTVMYRTIFDEVPVLSHQSMIVLAGILPVQLTQALGTQLGVPYETMLEIKVRNQPKVITNFEILWEWRGKISNPDMVHVLAEALKELNQKQYAEILLHANKENRILKRSDFNNKYYSRSNTLVKFRD